MLDGGKGWGVTVAVHRQVTSIFLELPYNSDILD